MSLRDDMEAALARFKLVEPFTIEDANVIAKHLRFALGGAEVEVIRNVQSEPVTVLAWRNGAVARVTLTPFASPTDARAHGT